jgi:beta-glucosidase
MARAYIDGFQTSTGKAAINNGWGYYSVNAMLNMAAGGPKKGAGMHHFAYGKFAVYPATIFKHS